LSLDVNDGATSDSPRSKKLTQSGRAATADSPDGRVAALRALDAELIAQHTAFRRALAAAQEDAARHAREAEQAQEDAARHAQEAEQAIEDLQERLFWLDRFDIDLNVLMDRRAVRGLRLAARSLRRIVSAISARRERLGPRHRLGPAEEPSSGAAPAPDGRPPGESASLRPLDKSTPAPRSRDPRPFTVLPECECHVYDEIGRVLHGECSPLEPWVDGVLERGLRIALVVPHFGFGSGGHALVFGLGARLEARGHLVSYWLHDPFELSEAWSDADVRSAIIDGYAPISGPAFRDFSTWSGADIVVATGWQTVYPVTRLPRCRARAYLVNDHEPEFYATSIESYSAEQTYRLGLPCIVGGGPWLRAVLEKRYDAYIAGEFRYPVAEHYRQRPVARRTDTIIFYARERTPRRAAGLGALALEELKRRRPDIRVLTFGDIAAPRVAFAFDTYGLIDGEALSWLYSEATIGMAFSMTHGSLVPHDMAACGLPVVDLDGFGTAAEHRGTGVVELVPFDPYAIADALEQLLDDPELRARRARAGLAYVRDLTWELATDEVETALRRLVQVPSRTVEATGILEARQLDALRTCGDVG
jgi:glycosyltransferase involved in cell wall biosynthesis